MNAAKVKTFRLPNLNAVLYKELRQKTKKSKLAVYVFLLNLVLTLIAIIILLGLASQAASYDTVSYDVFQTFFIALAFMEFGFVLLVAPAVTAGSITSEREKQTFDVLLSTALTTRQIIRGKYFASIAQVLLLLLSCFPIYALVFIYGGVSFFQALGVIVTLMFLTMYASALGVYFSACMKKSTVATVLTYVFLLIFCFGTISTVAVVKGIASLINEISLEQTGVDPNFTADPVVFLLYINPVCTIYDSVSGLFGISLLSSNPGMSGILSSVTDYSISNPLFTLWTPISIVIQMLISWGILEAAAKAIDPLKRKAKKHGKKNARKQPAA